MKRTLAVLLLLLTTGCGAGEPSGENEASGEPAAASQSEQQKALAVLSVFGTAVGLDDNDNVVSLHFTAARHGGATNAENGGITDATLVHLKSMTKLEVLGLDFARVTDAGLVHLAGLTNLKKIAFYATEVTGSGFGHLKPLTKLEELGGSSITDDGLANLKGMTSLKSLDLRLSPITDAGLAHLHGLTNLRSVRLGDGGETGSKITQEAVAELKKALPNCTINRSAN